MDQNVIERQTYSFLDWLGDIGGLYDALRIIGLFMVVPFSSFKLKAELLFHVFRFTKSLRLAEQRAKENESSLDSEVKHCRQDPR